MLKRFTLAALILATSLLSYAEPQRQPLHLVTLMDFKPFAWCDNNQAKGIDIEIVKRLLNNLQQPYQIECLPWRRALSYIESGKADGLFAGYKTANREHFAHFLSHPLHLSQFSVFVRKDQGFPFKSLDDLQGKRIGITAGYSINPEFDAAKASGKLDVFEASSVESGLNMLLRGRIDAYINGKHAGLYAARTMGILSMIEPLPQPVHQPKPAYMMISKSATITDKHQLLEAMNIELGRMWQQDEISAIMNSFMTSNEAMAVQDSEKN